MYGLPSVRRRQSKRAAWYSIKPAAILLDIGMPDMDGCKTCQLIRQQPWDGNVVVITVSGYGQNEDRQRSQPAGFDGHLVKPMDLASLMSLLSGLLKKE